jgi:hypothetical protein
MCVAPARRRRGSLDWDVADAKTGESKEKG